MKTEKTKDLMLHMLSSLESPSKELTPWELGFLENVSDFFNRTGTMSDKQFEVLEKIYAEKTA